jgi:membrane protease YdiL (CAAX protease family)
MIQVAARPGAGRVTVLVLSAALIRSLLAPLGELTGTAVFAVCLVGIVYFEAVPRLRSGQWSTPWSLAAGAAIGLILVAPMIPHGLTARPLQYFWTWGAAAGLIAILEEGVIRGPLQRRWTEEIGPAKGVLMAAMIFALIHLPRYGLAALPLDFAVGLTLGGLRQLSGRILPCAVAHCLADWGAWFWA